jgi:lysophospholipase L1-like esterase
MMMTSGGVIVQHPRVSGQRARRPCSESPGCALGVLTAALVFELILRPFVAAWNQPVGPVRTISSYFEGTSVAHFEPDGLGTYGNRLTGNSPLGGAPEGLIVGDSHVVAQAVPDEETMGAVIERLARAAGRPLNVHQYGWISANSPTYLASAEALLRSRNPAWVAVVLNAANISAEALTTRQNWRMAGAPDGTFRLIDMRSLQPTSRMQRMRQQMGRSALALALWRRFWLIQNKPSKEPAFGQGEPPGQRDPQLALEAARVPRATVHGLRKAYGRRLLIVYAPTFFGTRYDSSDPIEQEVLALCSQEGVACLSMRDALVRERYDQLRLSRGFHNTAPGVGHFNATGHRVIGQEIWRYLSIRSWPPT